MCNSMETMAPCLVAGTEKEKEEVMEGIRWMRSITKRLTTWSRCICLRRTTLMTIVTTSTANNNRFAADVICPFLYVLISAALRSSGRNFFHCFNFSWHRYDMKWQGEFSFQTTD